MGFAVATGRRRHGRHDEFWIARAVRVGVTRSNGNKREHFVSTRNWSQILIPEDVSN